MGQFDIGIQNRPGYLSLMVVCHCKAVFEREVRDLVRSGALSQPEVARSCGAGTDCGLCRPVLDEIIAEETATCHKGDKPSCERACLPDSLTNAAAAG